MVCECDVKRHHVIGRHVPPPSSTTQMRTAESSKMMVPTYELHGATVQKTVTNEYLITIEDHIST